MIPELGDFRGDASSDVVGAFPWRLGDEEVLSLVEGIRRDRRDALGPHDIDRISRDFTPGWLQSPCPPAWLGYHHGDSLSGLCVPGVPGVSSFAFGAKW